MNFAEASNRARGVVENSVVKAQAGLEVRAAPVGLADEWVVVFRPCR